MRRRDLDKLGSQLVEICKAKPDRAAAMDTAVSARQIENAPDAAQRDADAEREAAAEAEGAAAEATSLRVRGR